MITVCGIGVALFTTLSLCMQVPVFQNYYLCLGYTVMAVYLYFFGVNAGTIVGFFGTILYCLLINGLRGMPGWAIGNIFVAIILGYAFKAGKRVENRAVRYLIYTAGIFVGCGCGILFAKSLVEHLLYGQPIIIRMAVNMYAFVADLVVLLVSIPWCELLEPYMKKRQFTRRRL